MRRSLALPAIVAAIAMAGLTGCTDDTAQALELVRASSAKTIAAELAQVAITVETDVGGTPTTLTGEGGFDLAGEQGTLTLNLGSLLAGSKLDARIVGETAYVAPPTFLTALVGKPFLEIDLALLIAQNPQFGPLSSTASPISAVDALRGAHDAKEVATETVRGASTTHYRGRLDLTAALRKVEGGAAKSLSRLIALMRDDEVPYDVWLDGDGRVRRTTFSVTTEADDSADNTKSTTTVTTELYDFGSKVDVTIPPPDQVADGNAFLKAIASGSSGG